MSRKRRSGGAIEAGRELVDHVEGIARREVSAVRRELGRPWREGRSGRPAEVGRWIGFGLAVSSVLAGIAMALYVDRPWKERR